MYIFVSDFSKISLLHAICLLKESWSNVTAESIKNCWKKGGLAIQTLDEEADEDEDDETDDKKPLPSTIEAAKIILRGLLCHGYEDHAFLSKLEKDVRASAVKGMKQKTIDSFFQRKST